MKRMKNLVLVGLSSICAVIFLGGCSTIVLFDPKGPIGEMERFVIITAIVLMLIVVVPVFIMAFWFSRKFRASNSESTYMPKWSHSAKIEFTMWAVPFVIVMCLSALAVITTYSLDPYKPIPSADKSINIEVVSLDWKWLFIYPDQNVATVNEITFPVNVPISFRITSDTVMSSFFIPQLGSQIYAMAGMQTQLHLLANEPGVYAGQNQSFTGRGYADMYFPANAVSREEFESWVQKVKKSPEKLDQDRYERLAKPSDGRHPVTYFSSVKPQLFDHIIRKYHPTWGKHPSHMSGGTASTHVKKDVGEAN